MKKTILTLLTLLFGMMNIYADNISVTDVTIDPGQTGTVSIDLTNTATNMVSFQMDLTLPEGITLNKAACGLSNRFTDEDQELTMGRQQDGSIRLTSTSFALVPISGNNGTIITLSISASSTFSGGSATIKNIVFATSNSQRITMGNVTFNILTNASPILATGISLNTTSLTFTEANASSTMVATVTPSNVTDGSVTWTSSNTNVATVSSSGVVTAKANGTAVITATTNDGTNLSASCNVTVNIPVLATGISLNTSSLTFAEANATSTLIATVTPSNVTDGSVTWTSSNTNVATVSSSGVVTAKANGTAVITATTNDGTNLSASCDVIVNIPVLATGISLNYTSLSFTEANATSTLVATVTPSNVTDGSVTWTSSDTSVATVNENGVVTAVTNGTAVITATTNDGTNLSASCDVIVNIPVLATEISLNYTSIIFHEANETSTLVATVTPSNVTDGSVTWTSSNTAVATVSSSGVITAKANGTAVITATTNDGTNLSASCDVTVNIPVLATEISLNYTSIIFHEANETSTLVATVTPSNVTNGSVTWTSSNTSVATVDENGVVTAVGNGNAVITATTNDGTNLSASCNVTVNIPVLATDISLNTSSLTFTEANATSTLIATVTPSNVTDGSVTWTSSNTNVATVNSSGVVTAKANGTAVIIATTNDGTNLSASCNVTVQTGPIVVGTISETYNLDINSAWTQDPITINKAELARLFEIDENDLESNISEFVPLNADGFQGNNTAAGLYGAWFDANGNTTSYSYSGGNNVVYLESNEYFKLNCGCHINGCHVGDVYTVRMQYRLTNSNKAVNLQYTFNISEVVKATGILLNQTSLTFTQANATSTLVATVTPSNVTDGSVIWASSNTAVATVSSTGVVTAKSSGTAVITAKTNDGTNLRATCNVTVSITTDLINADFETDGASNLYGIRTYDHDITGNETSHLQAVTGWTITENGEGRAGGTFVYGSSSILGGSGFMAPVNSLMPNEHKALGLLSSWGFTAQYTQDVVLGPGKHMLQVLVYNSGGASAIATNLIGVAGMYATTKQYPVGDWTVENLEFELQNTQTVTVSLGYIPQNVGSNNMPHLFIEYAKLFHGDNAIATAKYDAAAAVHAFHTPQTIYFADSNVKAICVNNWDTDRDRELSYAEAAAVTSLGEVFKDNTTITSFNELQYFTGLTSITSYAFNGCSNLASVVSPSNVKTIEHAAFLGCSSLINFTLNDGLENISTWAFSGTAIQTINLPNSLTFIDQGAFYSCPSLISVTIPDGVTSLGVSAFQSCTSLSTVHIGSGITALSNSLFWGDNHLTSIVIPSNVKTIGEYCFGSCTSLESVIIQEGVERIENRAFSLCPLKDLILPSTISNIGSDYVFYSDEALSNDMIVKAINPPSTSSQGLFTNYKGYIFVPTNSLAAYKSAAGWSTFADQIKPIEMNKLVYFENATFNKWTTTSQNAFQYNTWSTENDNSGMTPQFIQVWSNRQNLDNSTVSHETLTGLESGVYKVQILARIYNEDNTTDYPSGITFHANDASVKLEDVGSTAIYNNQSTMLYARLSLDCIVNNDGILNIGFSIENAVGDWFTFKNLMVVKTDKLGQTISISSLPSMTYGDEAYTLPAQTEQGQALTWTSSNSSVATVSGNTLTIKGSGTATITATQAGNENYAALTKEYALTVNKASLTITADDKTKQEGTENPELTVSYSGFVYDDDASALTTPPTITTTATASSGVGTYPITVSGAAADNYDITYVDGTLTVEEVPLEDTDISLLDNVIYIEPFDVAIGGRKDILIYMKNSAPIRGFSFSLLLPEGITAAKSSVSGHIQASVVRDRLGEDDMHTISVSEQEDGSLLFLCNSLEDETFLGNDGVVAKLTVNVSNTMEEGDYPVILKNIKMSETDISHYYTTPLVKTTVTASSIVMMGDVNGDGVVDLSDYIGVANHIHNIPQTIFIEKAGDVDQDNIIDLSDYIGVANIIHYGSIYGNSSTLVKPRHDMELDPQ